ncbi:MAG: SulP family inorganic anion transporter [Taibaiella sp.]|nr:SulP family inorganic anion transporter [Taibaiella sp.]
MASPPYSFSFLKKDFLSGVIVFLIALPLCLGIAQASHAPLFAGIVAGVIGGIVVGTLSGSHLSVTGPAAGLTAIVMLAIVQLEHFNIFLCCVIIAGILQLGLGFLRAGGIANFIPSSVIEGMLAGIGLTIIIKQLPDAVGYAKNANAVMEDADDGFSLNTITEATQHMQQGAIIISVIGIIILTLWTTKGFKKIQLIPAGLVVVLLGTLINSLFNTVTPNLVLDGSHLVNLPIASTAAEFFHQFSFPDFSGFKSYKVWEIGVVIAIVASIETLLCIEATDKLDPQKRYTSTDRELKAQGIGNILSGFLGGLPVTSVIVRSSANLNAGAKSKAATIIHGVLLLVCAASIPFLLNMIPKAALAAILIFTGYKLCKPSFFIHMWKGGRTQFIPFVATVVGVVSLDLLKGVGIGLVISIFYILRQNARISYYMQRKNYSNGEVIKLTLAQEVSFLNKASIKNSLYNLPENSKVVIDASHSQYIDFDVLDIIREFCNIHAPDKNITMSLVGFKQEYNFPKVSSSMDMSISPDEKEVSEIS